jgi:two-component system chemotaxis response regulator CheB
MKAKDVAKDFPVVCVGGSAGGLDAYTRLLRHLPADMGVAIVIVNHLRTVATQLHELLSRPCQACQHLHLFGYLYGDGSRVS